MEEQSDIPSVVRTCLSCDYILTGLASPGKCPECARAFDLKDPRSTGPQRNRVAMFIAKASPPWYMLVPMVCVLAVALLLWSSPTGDVCDGPAWLMVVGVYGFGIAWSLPFLLSMFCRLIVRPRDGKFLRWLWRWSRPPLIFALAWYLQWNGVVWQIRWWHARDGFNDLRTSIAAGQPIPAVPFDIGTITVTNVQVRSGLNGAPFEIMFSLGWPDTAYSDWRPALVSTPTWPAKGWPIETPLGDNWFHCMDST